MTSTSDDTAATLAGDEPDPAERLERAADTLATARERVAAEGEASLQALRDRLADLRALFETYEDRATGSGDFKAFVEFQEELSRFTEGLSEDLPERATFEAVDEGLQQRRLTDADFERAREQLESVERTLSPLAEREDAREQYRRARRDLRRRLEAVEDRIDELEELVRLGDADLDAPTERLREPIEAYDGAVTEAFREYRSSAPAREVLDLVATTELYPLVPFDAPPDELLAYVRESSAGEESITQLLEYSEYSRSKLSHYVADADALKRTVATRRTYLQRLDGEPLTVGWPPPVCGVLRWRCDELVSVVGRFAPDLVPAVRSVRELTRRSEYDRLQESALARAELSAEQRERLQDGAIERELETARERRRRYEAALDEHPSP